MAGTDSGRFRVVTVFASTTSRKLLTSLMRRVSAAALWWRSMFQAW